MKYFSVSSGDEFFFSHSLVNIIHLLNNTKPNLLLFLFFFLFFCLSIMTISYSQVGWRVDSTSRKRNRRRLHLYPEKPKEIQRTLLLVTRALDVLPRHSTVRVWGRLFAFDDLVTWNWEAYNGPHGVSVGRVCHTYIHHRISNIRWLRVNETIHFLSDYLLYTTVQTQFPLCRSFDLNIYPASVTNC